MSTLPTDSMDTPDDQMRVRCTHCGKSLRVPASAAGHRARCPFCHQAFLVPRSTDLLEDTVSSWIESDVTKVLEKRNQRPKDKLEGFRRKSKPWPEEPRRVEWGGEVSGPRQVPTAVRDNRAGKPPVAEAMAAAAEARAASFTTGAPSDEALRVAAGRPFLAVQRADAGGVEIGFDAKWLHYPPFAASMPIRCAFTGREDREQLLARPMLFVDPSRFRVRNPRQMIRDRQQRVGPTDRPRSIVQAIDTLDSLPKPFDGVVVYYVSEAAADQDLATTVTEQNRDDGGLTCMVSIPDIQTALRWVGRVNGVCGPEYEQLENQSAALRESAWLNLPDTLRLRLGSWVKLEPGESFVMYFNDADFRADDPGWGGLVVTDRRLVFQKYHHHESVRLDEEAMLLLRTDGQVAHLAIESPRVCTRLGKLHLADLNLLVRLLQQAPALRVEVVGR